MAFSRSGGEYKPHTYSGIKTLYEKIRPIKGRAEDTRPMGHRSRDYETVEKHEHGVGGTSYAYRFHSTCCVEYYPDGSVVLRAGGWNTTSTASFIDDTSPFACTKHANQLWLSMWTSRNGGAEGGIIHFPMKEGMRFKNNGVGLENAWVMWDKEKGEWTNRVTYNTQALNKPKAKELRNLSLPFRNWAEAFLKLGDGWLMFNTRREVLRHENGWHGTTDLQLKEYLVDALKNCSGVEQEEAFLIVLFSLLHSTQHAVEGKSAGEREVKGWAYHDLNLRFAIPTFRKRLERLMRVGEEMMLPVEVVADKEIRKVYG